jgi:antibiotic biosynthesis monooxygenase (ABM) superfamily enzyme
MSNMSPAEQAVTALVSRRVKPGCEQKFEQVTAQLLQVAARAPGYLGSHLMHPGEETDVDDTLYHVVIAFDSQAHLDAWQVSEERALGLAASAPYVEGISALRNVSGLALWFRGARMSTPPRWKIAVVTWFGICPTVYLAFLLTLPYIASWALLPRIMLLTLIVVATMTWVVAPALTRLFRPWLHPEVPSVSGQTQR